MPISANPVADVLAASPVFRPAVLTLPAHPVDECLPLAGLRGRKVTGGRRQGFGRSDWLVHARDRDKERVVNNRLVMISGPIAAGKSTLAGEVARRLRARGSSVALTDLDTVAEMALPTLPDWDWAHRIHAQLVGAWLRSGIDPDFLRADHDTFARQLPNLPCHLRLHVEQRRPQDLAGQVLHRLAASAE